MEIVMLLQKYLSLHEWELNRLPFLTSVVGRHVYTCVAREVLDGGSNPEASIKKLLSTTHFTDRAIRLKIREMESEGFLISKVGLNDRRLRLIQPTQLFLELVSEHSDRVNQEILNDVMLVKK
jgi:hypothetical protein